MTAQSEPKAPAPTRTVRGELLEARRDSLTLRSPRDPELQLRVDETTSVTLDGKRARPRQLPEGSQVRASYREEAGELTAVLVEATSVKEEEAAPKDEAATPKDEAATPKDDASKPVEEDSKPK